MYLQDLWTSFCWILKHLSFRSQPLCLSSFLMAKQQGNIKNVKLNHKKETLLHGIFKGAVWLAVTKQIYFLNTTQGIFLFLHCFYYNYYISFLGDKNGSLQIQNNNNNDRKIIYKIITIYLLLFCLLFFLSSKRTIINDLFSNKKQTAACQ